VNIHNLERGMVKHSHFEKIPKAAAGGVKNYSD